MIEVDADGTTKKVFNGEIERKICKGNDGEDNLPDVNEEFLLLVCLDANSKSSNYAGLKFHT